MVGLVDDLSGCVLLYIAGTIVETSLTAIVLIDSLLTAKAATLIFISGRLLRKGNKVLFII